MKKLSIIALIIGLTGSFAAKTYADLNNDLIKDRIEIIELLCNVENINSDTLAEVQSAIGLIDAYIHKRKKILQKEKQESIDLTEEISVNLNSFKNITIEENEENDDYVLEWEIEEIQIIESGEQKSRQMFEKMTKMLDRAYNVLNNFSEELENLIEIEKQLAKIKVQCSIWIEHSQGPTKINFY